MNSASNSASGTHPAARVTSPTESTPATSAPVEAAPKTYHNVALTPICDQDEEEGCGGTQEVGSTVFTYTDGAEAGDYPDYWEHPVFQSEPTSCSTLTIRFSGDSWAQDGTGVPSVVDYLKFVQSSLPTIYAHIGVGQIGTVDVPLDGGPLYIDAAVANDNGVHNSYVLLNITGTCSTPDGVRP